MTTTLPKQNLHQFFLQYLLSNFRESQIFAFLTCAVKTLVHLRSESFSKNLRQIFVVMYLLYKAMQIYFLKKNVYI